MLKVLYAGIACYLSITIDRFDHIKANKSKLINNLFYNLLQFLTFVLYWFPTKNLDRSWTIGIGQTGRIFFSAEDYTNMSYYNCCGIRPKHSTGNISKGGGSIMKGKQSVLIYIVFLLSDRQWVPNTSIYSAVFLMSPYYNYL
jgi:hypothetical protein